MAHPLVLAFEKQNNFMDRELSESTKRKKKRKILIRITIAIIILIASIVLLRQFIRPKIDSTEFYTAEATIGNIQATVSASGTVLPEFEEIISSPITSKIKGIVKNTGDNISAGDTILLLDKRSASVSLEKMKDELAMKMNNENKLRLQLEQSLIDLKTQYQVKKLQVENMEAEVNAEKHLVDIGGGTKEKVEKAELNLQVSKLELEQIEQTITNKEKTMEADLYGLNYEISIERKNVNELQEKLNASTITVDKKGVITWINSEIGKSVAEGEDLVKIANLESFWVEGVISEMHASKLSPGGLVKVRINDDTEIPGEIVSISPSVESNTIRFKVKLDEKKNSLLRPNLKVDLFVVTSFKKNVVLVKNGPFYRGGSKQEVFVKTADKLIRKNVEFGESNFDSVEIVNGLSDGDEVVVSDMSEFERYEELTLTNK